jgi:SAM-dependent methyltransferase
MLSPLTQELIDLKIIDSKSIVPYYNRVRDRADVSVLRCNKSGVIFLNRIDHMAESYYNEKSGTSYWNNLGREHALKETYEDDERRFHQFKDLVKAKKYVDIGCGLGGVLERMSSIAHSAEGVELQKEIRDLLNTLGFQVHDSLNKLINDLEVVSMFHVFELVISPHDFLKTIYSKLAPGGKIIIEVPHAKDILLNSYNLDSFKAFTLWSEHLILHTKRSIRTYLDSVGFKNIHVRGFQRFPLNNHLLWLKDGKPGGQHVLKQLNSTALNDAYAFQLEKLDETDTIIAIAEK